MLGLLGCTEVHERPNVLVITLDTTRADHLGSYGYYRPTSVNLDALARESLVFEQMVVPMATTLPSHVSLFTGTHPLEHGVTANLTHGGEQLHASESLSTLPIVLQSQGYQTAAFVSATPLKRGSGIEVGFDVYSQPVHAHRGADKTINQALAWLENKREQDQPFLLWVHLFDPHGPFRPPEKALGDFRDDRRLKRWLRARQFAPRSVRPTGQEGDTSESANLYDGEIRFMDRNLGRLLDQGRDSDWWQNTVVVVVGDHGEGLGQHGMAGHGGTWREQLHAPWMIRTPWHTARRVGELVTITDVLPTVLGLVGLPGAAGLGEQISGRDVLSSGPVSQLEQSSDRQRAYGRIERALSVGRWRWIDRGEGEVRLHNLDHDPYELRDLNALHPVHAALMASWSAEQHERLERQGLSLGRAEATDLSADRLEQLRSLGYVEDDDQE